MSWARATTPEIALSCARWRSTQRVCADAGAHGPDYDDNMSKVSSTNRHPRPDINLEVGSGSHAEQTAQVMMRFEPVVAQFKPDWSCPGDVNSTLACALVAVKLGVRVAHVKLACARSIARCRKKSTAADRSDFNLLLTLRPEARENLACEGVAEEKIIWSAIR